MKRSVLGMLSVAAGVSIFSIQDVIVKGLSATLPVHEIVVLRSAVALPILLLMTIRDRSGRFSFSRAGLHVLRGFFLFLSYGAYYLAIAAMPIADAVAIYFITPLFIAGLAVPLLGERVSRRSWAAIAIGFAAVLVIVRPNADTGDPAAILPLLSALGYAVSAVLARRLGTTESASAMALSATLVYVLGGGAVALALSGIAPPEAAHRSLRFLLGPWLWPSAQDYGFLAVCGVIAAFGFFLLSEGYRLAEANRAAPFEYVALPWGVLWGFVVFGTMPDAITLGGAAVLIATGIYTLRLGQLGEMREEAARASV